MSPAGKAWTRSSMASAVERGMAPTCARAVREGGVRGKSWVERVGWVERVELGEDVGPQGLKSGWRPRCQNR